MAFSSTKRDDHFGTSTIAKIGTGHTLSYVYRNILYREIESGAVLLSGDCLHSTVLSHYLSGQVGAGNHVGQSKHLKLRARL